MNVESVKHIGKNNISRFVLVNHRKNKMSPDIKTCDNTNCINKVKREPTSWGTKCQDCLTGSCFFYPTKQQENFVRETARTVLLMGSVNSGKTEPSVYKMVLYCIQNPNVEVMVVGASRKRIHEILDPKLRKFIPTAWVAKSTSNNLIWRSDYIQFINNSILRFFASESIADIKGSSINKAYVVEASTIKTSILEEIYARLRSETGEVYARDNKGNFIYDEITKRKKVLKSNSQVIFDFNPEQHEYLRKLVFQAGRVYYCEKAEVELNKLKRFFVEPNDSIVLHHLNVENNPYASDDYIKSLKNVYHKEKYQVSFKGGFYSKDKYVFQNIDENVLDKPYNYQHNSDIEENGMGIDFGLRNGMGYVVVAFEKSGRIVAYKAKETKDMTIVNSVEDINELKADLPKLDLTIFGDPSAGNVTLGGQIAQSYLNKGVYMLPAKESKNFEGTIRKINTYLRLGLLKFCPTVGVLINEMKEYKTKPLLNNSDVLRAKYTIGKDEVIDALRYVLNDKIIPKDEDAVLIKAKEKTTEEKLREIQRIVNFGGYLSRDLE